MADADHAFVQATDDLIALYRNIERRTLDLSPISVMPMLIYFWAVLRFTFFLYVGLFLIVPTNLVILVRNLLFTGHWRYRPFFLRHLHYVWLWVWRGEAPFAPSIFVRPLLIFFMKGHFESRLRRLRFEIALHDGVSDATRSTLLGRLDTMLERWKSPRVATVFFSMLLPGIVSLPTWHKQLTDAMAASGIHIPVDEIVNFASEHIPTNGLRYVGLICFGYLLAIPLTAFLAKRGLFIGEDSNNIYFPGGQESCGSYLKEREILGNVQLHARETPTDFLVLGFVSLPFMILTLVTWDYWMPEMPFNNFAGGQIVDEQALEFAQTAKGWAMTFNIIFAVAFCVLFFIAVLRRARAGRS
jgi:hypothetical protein